MYLNPLEHTSIATKSAISLTSHEVLVVYRPEDTPQVASFSRESRSDMVGDDMSPLMRNTSSEGVLLGDMASLIGGPENGAMQGYTAKVRRILIRGPAMHVPEPNEWNHEFVWHGTDRNNK